MKTTMRAIILAAVVAAGAAVAADMGARGP